MLRFKEHALGELELAVCNALWELKQGDVRAVHGHIGVARGISSNTIQSTMERLYRKGVLSREKVSHAFQYSPLISRAGFAAGVMDGLAAALGAQPLLSAFVEHSEHLDAAMLDELEASVQKMRARKLASKPMEG